MNTVPFDKNPAINPSGIRIGTPAMTTRGFKEKHFLYVAALIDKIIKSDGNKKVIKEVKKAVLKLLERFPLYKGLEY